MLKRLKTWWYTFKQDFKAVPLEDVVIAKNLEVKECTRDKATRKRVAKSIEAQEQSMNARALKPHACNDPLTCSKVRCFKRVPDKIVSDSYQVERRKSK